MIFWIISNVVEVLYGMIRVLLILLYRSLSLSSMVMALMKKWLPHLHSHHFKKSHLKKTTLPDKIDEKRSVVNGVYVTCVLHHIFGYHWPILVVNMLSHRIFHHSNAYPSYRGIIRRFIAIYHGKSMENGRGCMRWMWTWSYLDLKCIHHRT